MTNFGPKLPYWPQVVPAASKWVEYCWLNMVEHCISHLGVHLGPQDVLKNSYIWLFQVKTLHFWILLGHPWDISGGAKRTQRTPHDVRYNVQPCSTWFGWLGLPMARRQNFGGFWGPLGTFSWGKKGPTDHPRSEIQCSTQFDPCSTNLRQPEPLMANVAIFWPKLVTLGPFGPPRAISGGPKRSQLTTPRREIQC